jgi:hypothetical protein
VHRLPSLSNKRTTRKNSDSNFTNEHGPITNGGRIRNRHIAIFKFKNSSVISLACILKFFGSKLDTGFPLQILILFSLFRQDIYRTLFYKKNHIQEAEKNDTGTLTILKFQ